MLISFDLDDDEVKILIDSLHYSVNHSTNLSTKQKLLQIIQEVQADVSMEQIAFINVRNLLDPLTTGVILKSSNLRSGLSISSQWIKNFLHLSSNNIIKRLIANYKPGSQPNTISKSEAEKCETVQDIVDLIKRKYEGS